MVNCRHHGHQDETEGCSACFSESDELRARVEELERRDKKAASLLDQALRLTFHVYTWETGLRVDIEDFLRTRAALAKKGGA